MQNVIYMDKLGEWQSRLRPGAVHTIREAQMQGYNALLFFRHHTREKSS